MLLSAKEMQSYSVHAADGDVGSVTAFFFDDESWRVRYVVVKAGGFFANRRVLVAPEFIEDVDRHGQVLRTGLTREQVKDAPGIEADRPVAAQQETAYYDYYAAEPYWGSGWSAGLPGGYAAGADMGAYPPERAPEAGEAPREGQGDPHLRNTGEVAGYHIGATDGEVGHVEDFVVDVEEWAIRYVVVDTRNWLPGKKVLVSPDWVQEVSWLENEVHVDLTRDEIKSAPGWDGETPPDREYETRLHEHYGRPPYWVYR